MSALPNWHIREAQRNDVPAIAVLIEEFSQYMWGLGDTSELRFTAEIIERDGFGPDPAFHGLVAVQKDSIVGFLFHHPGYDTDAACRLLFIIDLYVTSAARAMGIGAGLMEAARTIAQVQGAKQIVWTVDKRNTFGRRFYERIGAHNVDGLELMYLDV